MRLLLLTGEHPEVPGLTGGIGSFTADASRALADAGHDVHVLVCAPALERSDLTAAGVVVHARGFLPFLRFARGSTLSQLALSASCWWHARALGGFDAVEAPEWQAIAAGLALWSPGRLLICLQTPTSLIARYDTVFKPPTRFNDWLERWTVRRAGAVVSLSALLVRELRSQGWLPPSTHVDVVPPLVHISEWEGADPARPAPGPCLVGVGRVEERKGFDLLVDVAAELKDVPGLHVEILGDLVDPVAHRLRDQAERLGVTLQLNGRVDRSALPEILARASAMVLPSRFDSFNLAGLEALAAGVPVATSDLVGLAELGDGSEGLMVVPREAAAVAAALRPLLLDDDRRARAAAAARTIAAGCSPSRFVQDRVARYEELRARSD